MEEQEEIFKRTQSDKVIAKRLLAYAWKYKSYFIAGLVIILISVPINSFVPILIKQIIDILVPPAGLGILAPDSINFNDILIRIIIMSIILVINAFSIYMMHLLLQKASQKINYELREEVFAHIEKFSANQFNLTPVGKYVTRVTNDVNSITAFFSNVILGIIRNSFVAIMALVYMIYISPFLTLLVLSTLPLLVIGTFIYRKVSRKAYRDSRTHNTTVNSFLSEHISGVKITQMFNREETEYLKYKEKNKLLLKANMRTMYSFAFFRPFIHLLFVLAALLVLHFGGIRAMTGVITVGVLVALYDYLGQFFSPLQNLSEQFDTLQSAFASAEKVFTILDTIPEIQDSEDAIELNDIQGRIEFRNVWFYYKENEWILKDVSFVINPGETVAFVGETGSGKTTILSLITRNYEIQKGEILLDGININNIKLESLRGCVSPMLQDVFLFSGTVETNIKLRDTEKYSDSEMIEAAKYVNADKFISLYPENYQREVLERGNNYSAGERQLLSFARAILHKPKIIILDEATANIDTETEHLIQDSLEKIMGMGTMLMVAHRLSTIQNSDKIIVLEKGEIIESGSHKELIKNKKHYYQLYLMQFDKNKTNLTVCQE